MKITVTLDLGSLQLGKICTEDELQRTRELEADWERRRNQFFDNAEEGEGLNKVVTDKEQEEDCDLIYLQDTCFQMSGRGGGRSMA
ncbi:hypothetical protein J1614_004160 [Plenodomus biglobosus]|nr:hypothetical protein J1614_004160 [Plenodomus biglobosus]